ncbi:MAG: HlyC/CorC family transporter [Myxococcales bacterium]|nr:HlyC/CorC family transporter [Myxococcales bacterium]
MDKPPAGLVAKVADVADVAEAADDPLSAGLLVIGCLAFSFLFAGSETAITSMGEPRIRRLLDEGVGPKRFLQTWLDDHSAILTSLLAGNTLVNIIASALTTSLTLDLVRTGAIPSAIGEWAVSAGVFLLTMLVLVVGEIAPKTLAKSHPTWFLRPFWVVWGFHLATTRVTSGLNWIAKRLIAFLGVDTDAGGFVVTEEQIEDMVRIGAEEGSIDDSRGSLLQNVFDLWDTAVRSIMTPRTQVVSLQADMSHESVVDTIRESGYSRYPVYDTSPDDVIGVFYARTLLQNDAAVEQFSLRQHLSPTMFVPETQKAASLLKEFQTEAVHMAVVVDEHGGTAGVVSLEDVLEELVGEIYDEHDEVDHLLVCTAPDVWEVDASAELRTVEEDLNVELPEETPYSTVGGFVVDQLGKLPDPGDTMEWNRLKITVLAADDKKVLRVEIRVMPPDEELPKAG